MNTYVLEGKTPVAEPDLIAYAQWRETADRTVAKTALPEGHVSTVFLGLDHALPGEPPLLFETCLFTSVDVSVLEQYTTWEEAEAGHIRHVERLEAVERGARDELSKIGCS